MGGGRRRNKNRQRRFVAIHAFQEGNGNLDGLIQETKRYGRSNQTPQRNEEALAVADKARKVADAVSELFLINLPVSFTAPSLVQAIFNLLRRKGLLSLDEYTTHVFSLQNSSIVKNSPVLRCELLPSKRRFGTQQAFVSMRTENFARMMLQCSPLPISGFKVKVLKSTHVSIPGLGSAWRASRDPGSIRWKIGTVQVGEKVTEDEFSAFWTSSPFFDLSENSHVELNPVDSVLAITVGRPRTMKKASHMFGPFSRTFSMLRIVVPFRSICAEPIPEQTSRASEEFAIYFPVSKPPLLFRVDHNSTPHNDNATLSTANKLWDCLGGVGEDIRWVRTIDPTPSAAFSRTRAIRIMLGKNEIDTLFKELHRLCIVNVARPEFKLARAQNEKDPPDRCKMFREVASCYGISFAVRYMVDCVLSLGNLRLADIGPDFWQTLSCLDEDDAVIVLDFMLFRLSDNESFAMINDPVEVLHRCAAMCNVTFTKDLVTGFGSLDISHGGSDNESDVRSTGTASSDDSVIMEQYTGDLKLDELSISDDGESSVFAEKSNPHVPDTRVRKPSRQHTYIRRLICTPTRIIAMRAESDLLNRILREFAAHKDRFLRISFSDEDGGSIAFAGSNDLYARVRGVLEDGIECAGERFVFLAFSNSQLRDHAAWMYNETPDPLLQEIPPTADDIRKWMGDFSKIRVPGKFAARQDQTFSSTVGTVVLNDVQEGELKDVFDKTGEYMFSDGVGLMSSDLASHVARKLRIPRWKRLPSAFQVRFGGAKGMLTVWDDALPAAGGVQVALRPSMKKFDCNHKALEIVGYAKRLPLYLNRQIIMLLSGMGVPDKPFEDMQRDLLKTLDRAMQKDGGQEALHLLFTSGCGESDSKIRISAPMMNAAAFFRAGLDCRSCEHLFNMMRAFRRRTVRDLMQRARIPIDYDKGVCAIGVMDERGVLGPNEIFCRFTRPDSGKLMLVKGKVTVGRSPCLHPGDIQVCRAVDNEYLHDLVDVIVFPRCGERPLPSMLSGGDLDGDIFFCIFDNRLAQRLIHPPMNYSAPNPVELNHDVTTSDVADFFVEYIRNDNLGQIANAHVVHADKEKNGIFSGKCLELAELHSTAVDFAKSGRPAVVPRELFPRNVPKQYPDFMGKHAKVSYPSEKILGKLFRACNTKQSGKDGEHKFSNSSSAAVDEIIDGFPDDEKVLLEAEKMCSLYNFELSRLMVQYGVRNEGEIVSGQVLSFATRHAQLRGRREYFALVMRMNRQTNELRNEFRDKFFQGLGVRANDAYTSATLIKACAWYKACQRRAKIDRKEKNTVLVSFPWVVSDVLLKIIENELRNSTQKTAKWR